MSGKYSTKDISIRFAGEMKDVLREASAVSGREQEIFYTVYRNIEIIDGKIRRDITEIPAGNVGSEFRKTFGHYHENKLPELYEVLEGHTYFLLQKYKDNPAEITEAYIVEAGAGEKAVIPPGFGHLSINIGEKTLVMANWIGLAEYDYETYKNLHGGCYYVIDAGATALPLGSPVAKFEKNNNYKSVPELKKLKLKNLPNGFDWLINPEKYKELLTIEKLYREI